MLFELLLSRTILIFLCVPGYIFVRLLVSVEIDVGHFPLTYPVECFPSDYHY